MWEHLIEISWLSRSYPATWVNLFENFALTLDSGDFCFVMWRSGVGKTTLVKLLMRQLTPPLGTMFHKKDDLARLSSQEVQAYRRSIGVVYQDYKLVDRKTVRENVSYTLYMQGMWEEEIYERTTQILEQVGIADKQNDLPHSLSWWEKQKVAIARALVHNPEFLIADEPTGNLDWQSTMEIADLLGELHSRGITILCITHDPQFIEYCRNQRPVRVLTVDKK